MTHTMLERPTPSTDAARPRSEQLLDQLGGPLEPARYDWSGSSCPGDEDVFRLTYAAQVEWATQGTFASLDISVDQSGGARSVR